MEMPTARWGAAIAVLGLALLPVPSEAQSSSSQGALARQELFLTISTEPDGPTLSATEFKLTAGKYYRLNITSDGGKTWRLDVSDLLQNSHLRIVTISEIEVHLQGLVFRAIEFDKAGSARFSFTPMRPGTYEFSVRGVPFGFARGRPIGEAGALGRFIVE